jgi:hypothetical protein
MRRRRRFLALSPDAFRILYVEHAAMPSIADVARPMDRLAGLRIDPVTKLASPDDVRDGLRIGDVFGGHERVVEIPGGRRILVAALVARLATLRVPAGRRRGERVCGSARASNPELNLVADPRERRPFQRFRVDAGRRAPARGSRSQGACRTSRAALVPRGPKVLEARGDTTPLRTYQDLLANEHDERLFEHFTRSELVLCDPRHGLDRAAGRRAHRVGFRRVARRGMVCS